MERTMAEKLTAEFVGAFALIFIGAGSVVTSLLGASNLVGVALAHGLVIAVMVSAVGHVSGGHFNPAVTISAWITQKIKASDAIGYVIAQLAGGAAGAFLLKAALGASLVDNPQVDYGVPKVLTGQVSISSGKAVLIEAVLTFFLVWVIFATAVDPEGAFNKVAGLAIGFTITLDILFGGPFTGAAMNPARHFGPALASGFWDNWWVYWVGPIAGGIVAAVLYDSLIIKRPGSAAAGESAPGTGAHGEESMRPEAEM
ncbi:MAG: MIP family channel protein [Actinomycetota bacterium]